MDNEDDELIQVEVAYAEPDSQFLVALEVSRGTTALQAIELSGVQEKFPALHDSACELGIFSKKCAPDHVLQAGDRVEIYRPLLIDPKAARRLKAEVAARRKAEGERSVSG